MLLEELKLLEDIVPEETLHSKEFLIQVLVREENVILDLSIMLDLPSEDQASINLDLVLTLDGEVLPKWMEELSEEWKEICGGLEIGNVHNNSASQEVLELVSIDFKCSEVKDVVMVLKNSNSNPEELEDGLLSQDIVWRETVWELNHIHANIDWDKLISDWEELTTGFVTSTASWEEEELPTEDHDSHQEDLELDAPEYINTVDIKVGLEFSVTEL